MQSIGIEAAPTFNYSKPMPQVAKKSVSADAVASSALMMEEGEDVGGAWGDDCDLSD